MIFINKESTKYEPTVQFDLRWQMHDFIIHASYRLYSQSQAKADAQKLTQCRRQIAKMKNWLLTILEYLLTVVVQQLFKDLIRSIKYKTS